MYQPYSYQDECLGAIRTKRKSGAKKALMVMACGLGKTVTMAFDAKEFRQEKGGGRVLFLCHNNDILYQAKSTFQAINGPEHSYGYFHGEEKNFHSVDFLFASLQTMDRCRELFNRDEFAYVFVDESHHSQAETFKPTIEYFRPEFLLGATATPDRLDELDIREIFGKEVYYLPLEEALARGLLTPIDYRLLSDEMSLEAILSEAEGRPSVASLNRRIFIPKRDEEIAKIIDTYGREFREPRTMIFCNSIKHCEHLSQFIPDSFAIHSRTPSGERTVKLEMFRRGLIRTILTIDAFNEGVDIPQANLVVFLRSTVSKTIFLQQLGRGLRKSEGKDKLVVLDFVGNCERIKMVHDLWRDVEERAETVGVGKESGATRHPLVLNAQAIQFTEKIVPVLRILEQIGMSFYPSWEDAAKAATDLGITSKEEYASKYAKDPKLPSSPSYTYENFPGWEIFLGKRSEARYNTWRQASKAAVKLGIRTVDEYRDKYKQDPKLPADPPSMKDFPGWVVFLGRKPRNIYKTWKEVEVICKKKKISTVKEYRALCDKDARLPRHPWDVYPDFPGFSKILVNPHRRVTNPYPTWKQAGKAARKIGIMSSPQYSKRYKEDERLYASPSEQYDDFPGWATFLGIPEREIVENPYPTWQQASRAAKKLGIKSGREYRENYKKDPRLMSSPHRLDGFPGWTKFLGR